MVQDLFGIVGTAIAGTYEVEAVVAEGGFAIVYRALHTGFGAKVALKCLKLSRKVGPERQAEFLAQFKAEASLLFQLSSSIPTVVRPLHIDALTTKEGTFVPYMVLEWLEGETLAAIIQHRAEDRLPPPPLKKLVRLLGPVAQALARAHDFTAADGTAVSIVHQDIKPENIFVASTAGEQVVKILDYGVAKAQSVASQVAGSSASERSGVHSFTPAYAAPEQWAPDKYGETGPWTDVWGLALTLVEAMAGRLIIDGDIATMMGMTLDPVARPTPLNNDVDVSPEIEAVFERALALQPKNRHAHVGQFWDELLTALGMKEGHRDARREVGAMLREERVEVAKAKAKALPPKNALGRVQLKAAPKAPLALPKHRLTIDDPFELDDPPSPFGGVPVAAPAEPRAPRPQPKPSLELSLPPLPPGAQVAVVSGPRAEATLEAPFGVDVPSYRGPQALMGGVDLEAAIPSVPPPPSPSSFEASIPSMSPSAVARPAAPAAPAGLPRGDFELEMPAAPRKAEHRPDPLMNRNALDVDAAAPSEPPQRPSLEASLRPEPRGRLNVGSEIDLGTEAPALSVDLRSEVPPRPGVGAPRAPPVRSAPTQTAPKRGPPMRASAELDQEGEAPRRRVNLLGVGIGLIVGAIAIALTDRALRSEDGTPAFSLGPISLMIVAGVLLAAGVGLLIYQLLPHDEH